MSQSTVTKCLEIFPRQPGMVEVHFYSPGQPKPGVIDLRLETWMMLLKAIEQGKDGDVYRIQLSPPDVAGQAK